VIVTGYYSRKGFLRSIWRRPRPGLYPALYLSGIHDHCSPALRAEISMMSVILSSFEEARRIVNWQMKDAEIRVKSAEPVFLNFTNLL